MAPQRAPTPNASTPRPPIGGALPPEREISGTGTLLLAGAAGASALWLFLNLGMGLGSEPVSAAAAPTAEESVKASDFGVAPEALDPRTTPRRPVVGLDS